MNAKKTIQKCVYIFLFLAGTLSIKAGVLVGGSGYDVSADITDKVVSEGWSWTAASQTLTLSGNYNGKPVEFSDLTGNVYLKFVGDITINAEDGVDAIQLYGSSELSTTLHIVGDESHTLTVNGKTGIPAGTSRGTNGIFIMYSDLLIKDATVVITGGWIDDPDTFGGDGIDIWDGKLTIEYSTVNVKGGVNAKAGDGIRVDNGITINASTVTASGGDNSSIVSDDYEDGEGISCGGGPVVIRSGSVVTANSSTMYDDGGGIVGESIEITSSTLNATGSGMGIAALDNMNISYSEVNAIGVASEALYIETGKLIIHDRETSKITLTNGPSYQNPTNTISHTVTDGVWNVSTSGVLGLPSSTVENTIDNSIAGPFTLKVVSGNTGIANNETFALKLYPNPAVDILKIDGLQGGEAIQINDLSGRIVGESLTIAQAGAATFNVSTLPKGVYSVRIITNDKAVKILKLIKE